MGTIAWGRVVVGGLVAGIVMTIGELLLNTVMAEEAEAMMEALGATPPGPSEMIVFTVMGLGVGILLVWLYAAMRPRFGPGPATALRAAVVVWLLLWGWYALFFVLTDVMPAGTMAISTLWGLVEVSLAALAGGWVYREPVAG